MFLIGEKVFEIPINELYIKKKQVYNFEGMGMALIDPEDIYNVANRGDICIHIDFIDWPS